MGQNCNLIENYVNVVKNAFNYQGRATRREYWMFVLACILGTIIITLLTFIPFIGILIAILGYAFYICNIVSGIAVGVRRLHDIDKCGWWILLSFVPIGNIILIIFMAMRGTIGTNRYGADPYEKIVVDIEEIVEEIEE